MAYKLAHNGTDWDDKVVDKPEGMKALARWVRLHPRNIAQKVEVIVEHFRHTVADRLDGKAKAMVVTGSRQEAVRYKLAMDKYIAASGYTNIATLVAFSGEVIDPDSGPDKFNEVSMNTQLHGQSIREAFRGGGYQVLIVANKFQTGFDQPLLVAMYVDKRLDGITAVQTLSRLNRTYPGKDATFVLDFVNDAETMRLAFAPYYKNSELLATTDPNLIYDLQNRLAQEQIYTDLAELIQKLNDLFDDGSLTEADKVGMFQHVAGKMIDNPEITKQARANTKAQFTHSPTIGSVLIDALVAAMDSYQAMGKKVFQDQAAMVRFRSMMVDYVYDKLNGAQAGQALPE